MCRHYQREIAAYDIQTKRVDTYGQDAGYSERCMVIYDGEPTSIQSLGAFTDWTLHCEYARMVECCIIIQCSEHACLETSDCTASLLAGCTRQLCASAGQL